MAQFPRMSGLQVPVFKGLPVSDFIDLAHVPPPPSSILMEGAAKGLGIIAQTISKMPDQISQQKAEDLKQQALALDLQNKKSDAELRKVVQPALMDRAKNGDLSGFTIPAKGGVSYRDPSLRSRASGAMTPDEVFDNFIKGSYQEPAPMDGNSPNDPLNPELPTQDASEDYLNGFPGQGAFEGASTQPPQTDQILAAAQNVGGQLANIPASALTAANNRAGQPAPVSDGQLINVDPFADIASKPGMSQNDLAGMQALGGYTPNAEISPIAGPGHSAPLAAAKPVKPPVSSAPASTKDPNRIEVNGNTATQYRDGRPWRQMIKGVDKVPKVVPQVSQQSERLMLMRNGQLPPDATEEEKKLVEAISRGKEAKSAADIAKGEQADRRLDLREKQLSMGEQRMVNSNMTASEPIKMFERTASNYESAKENVAKPNRSGADDVMLLQSIGSIEQPNRSGTGHDLELTLKAMPLGEKLKVNWDRIKGIIDTGEDSDPKHSRILDDQTAQLLVKAGESAYKAKLDTAAKHVLPTYKHYVDHPDLFIPLHPDIETRVKELAAGNEAATTTPATTTPAAAPTASSPAAPIVVTSQAEYDALPSGSYYKDSHGKLSRKK